MAGAIIARRTCAGLSRPTRGEPLDRGIGYAVATNMPFSHERFLDVFGAYNSAVWPAAVALWLATAWVAVRSVSRARIEGRTVLLLLAVHWLWSGIAYHWLYFRGINAAAGVFAAFFVAQGAVFAWLAVRARRRSESPGFARSARVTGSPRSSRDSDSDASRSGGAGASPSSIPRVQFAAALTPRGVVGASLVVYGLAYPFLGLAFGLDYPRLPLFAVPCPTTLVTAGMLVCASGLPRAAGAIPMLWCLVAGSAAFALGIYADLALFVAALLLAVDTVMPSALGPRPQLASHAAVASR
ncbi:MAG: DUF6064 family protein [Vicinamibacterales bacterium]